MNKTAVSHPSNELRTHSVNVRFNLFELQELDMLRNKRTRAAYLRDTFFNNVPAPVPEINREAYIVLAQTSSDIYLLTTQLDLSHDDRINQLMTILTSFRLSLLRYEPK